ncbi:MAG: hypothetical protein NTX36_03415 [Proteobacteria bacterium]|nr:hypothetical protein [Pseudomonadota bacterium]
MNFFIGIIILIGVIGAIFGIRIIRSRFNRAKKGLAKLAGDLGAELQRNAFKGFFKNIPYACQYQAGNRNRPSSLTIDLHRSFPENLVIRREGWFDRFSKAINLASEIQTGDPLFDSTFYIESEKAPFIESFLMDGSKREVIYSLFSKNQKVKKMIFSGNGVSLIILPFVFDDVNPSQIEEILGCLTILTEGLPGGTDMTARGSILTGSPVIFIFAGGLLGFLGLAALITGNNLYCPVDNDIYGASFSYSLPLLFTFVLFIYFFLRGSSRSHKVFFTAAAIFTVAFIVSTMGGMVFANGYLDATEPVTHRVQIIGKYYKTHKSSRTYYITFPSWTKPGEPNNIRVESGFYRSLRRGESVTIRTGKGFLGYEWLASVGLSEKSD